MDFMCSEFIFSIFSFSIFLIFNSIDCIYYRIVHFKVKEGSFLCQMKENEDLVIAKIDATANDAPAQFAVSGFPTIYWAPKDNKKSPTKYNVSHPPFHGRRWYSSKSSSKQRSEV